MMFCQVKFQVRQKHSKENVEKKGLIRYGEVKAYRKPIKEEEPALVFECRICGCKTYKSNNKSNGVCGPGSHSSVLFYYCDGCSCIFQNPEKFSIANKKP